MKNPSLFVSSATVVCAVTLFLALHQSSDAATMVTVPNASFETPNVTGTDPYFTQYTLSSTPIVGSWVRYGASGFAAVVEGGRYGALPIGLSGTQFSNQSARGATGVFQDIAPYDGSGLSSQYWQADMTYSFTVGVFTRSDNPVTATTRLDIKLYSRANINAAADVHGGVSVLGSAVNSSSLTDFSFTYTTSASDTFIGQPIGIWFDSINGSGQDWGYDNVRLSFDPVPEVSSLMAGMMGGVLLLRRRR
ncbi:MAG: hypothetical protein EOP85_02630 [Verrucomicrobiaceae bacterium]|nr:MAG: hypothetical protein EOP85_02630 [Verrucomicrobiaceae bacterium]